MPEDLDAPLEDIGLKIGTKEQKAWTDIKEHAEKEIEQSRRMILMDEEIVKLAERMVAQEIAKV